MEILQLCRTLTSRSRRERVMAAAELGDVLESGSLSRVQVELALSELIEGAVNDPDPAVRESILNALATGICTHSGTPAPWRRLTGAMHGFHGQCLEHALCALGLSGDRRLIPAIRAYRNDPDPTVREAATEALFELEEGQHSPGE